MPIKEVCSPWSSNRSKGPKLPKIQHAPVYGPPTGERDDAARPATRPVPGQVVDGTLTIRHTGKWPNPARALRSALSHVVKGRLRRDETRACSRRDVCFVHFPGVASRAFFSEVC
jgi:hypothetical protein